MSTIQPKGERLRKAVTFIAEGLKYEPEKPVRQLIQSACMTFNLSPKDEAYLTAFYRKSPKDV